MKTHCRWVYMFTNIGLRLNQKIALAVADADGQSPQEPKP